MRNSGLYLGAAGAYVGLVLAVGLVFRRRLKDFLDYFLAGRELPAWLVYASLCAAWIGATSMLVSADEAYASGLSAFWLMGLPAILTVVLMALFLAGPIRRLLSVSLPELFEARYGRVARDIASALIVWYMVLLAASQMVALGSFLELFTGRSYLSSLVVGTALVLFYSILGGFFTVAVTDLLHFVLLGAGILALVVSLAVRVPLSAVGPAAAAVGRRRYFDFSAGLGRNALIVLSFVLAWLISPIAWQRIQASRSVRQARRALWASAGTFGLLYGLIVLGGVLALPFFGGRRLDHPLLAELIASRPGLLLEGLLFVGVLAAILSTMDTAVNAGALPLAHDVLGRIGRPGRDGAGRRGVVLGRLATLLVGGLAFLVATRFTSILRTLGLASEVMAEGMFVPGMIMLFLKRRLPAAGLLSLGLGGGFALLSFLDASGLIRSGLPVWPASVPYGLALSFAGFAIGWALERRPFVGGR
jgi:SSS family solute:Na+ symporter